MGMTGRDRMIDSVVRLTGETCGEAVVLQERRPWVVWLAALAGIATAGIAASFFDLPSFVFGALAGAAVAAVFVGLTTYWIVAHTPSAVVLVRSKKAYVSGIEVVDRYQWPVEVATTKGIITDKVTFGGRTFRLAKQFRKRFEAVVGSR